MDTMYIVLHFANFIMLAAILAVLIYFLVKKIKK